jgi:hypothetical protein
MSTILLVLALVALTSAATTATTTTVHESEPADDCWSNIRRRIEHAFSYTFQKRVDDEIKHTAVLKDAEATHEQKDKAMRRLMGQKLAESLTRFNHDAVMEALRDDCQERERALGDPCTTITYDARTEQCVKRTTETQLCLERRKRKPGWALSPI